MEQQVVKNHQIHVQTKQCVSGFYVMELSSKYSHVTAPENLVHNHQLNQ